MLVHLWRMIARSHALQVRVALDWRKRACVARRFVDAGRRVMYRLRAQKRLERLQALLGAQALCRPCCCCSVAITGDSAAAAANHDCALQYLGAALASVLLPR
jgi:hypothetical protein